MEDKEHSEFYILTGGQKRDVVCKACRLKKQREAYHKKRKDKGNSAVNRIFDKEGVTLKKCVGCGYIYRVDDMVKKNGRPGAKCKYCRNYDKQINKDKPKDTTSKEKDWIFEAEERADLLLRQRMEMFKDFGMLDKGNSKYFDRFEQ
jgi:hypothetical protein